MTRLLTQSRAAQAAASSHQHSLCRHRPESAAVINGGLPVVGEDEQGPGTEFPMTIGKSPASSPNVEARPAVDEDLAQVDFHLLARQSDDPFDEPKVGYQRMDKDGDRSSGRDVANAGATDAIAVGQGRLHRAIDDEESRHARIEYVRTMAGQLARFWEKEVSGWVCSHRSDGF